MATVIGMTAARGDEIANEHIETATIDGDELVLTRRNAEEVRVSLASIAGGGGGAPLGSCEVWSSTGTLKTSGEGGIVPTGLNWGSLSDVDGLGIPDGVSVDSGTGKILLAEAGWYNIAVWVELAFFMATINPTYVRIAFNVGNSLIGNSENWPEMTTVGGTNKHVKTLFNLGLIYSDGTAYLRPELYWDGGYGTPASRTVGAYIVRVS